MANTATIRNANGLPATFAGSKTGQDDAPFVFVKTCPWVAVGTRPATNRRDEVEFFGDGGGRGRFGRDDAVIKMSRERYPARRRQSASDVVSLMHATTASLRQLLTDSDYRFWP